MARPTHFTNGVTNVKATDAMGDLKVPDPSQMHLYFDDFDIYNASDWTVTTTEAGTGSASEAIQDEDGGVLKLTNDDADDDNDFLQLASETFKFESGKKLLFKSRFKVSDATQSDFVLGLQITDTSPLAVSDGVFFQKDDGDDNLDFHVEKDSTSSDSTDIHTMADDTYVTVAYVFTQARDGSDTIEVYVDGSQVATADTTNLPDDEELTVSFGVQNGAAAAKSMSVDYILAAKER